MNLRAVMSKAGIVLFLVLISTSPGCDLFNGDVEPEGSPSLIQNGSFEIFTENQGLLYWSFVQSGSGMLNTVNDAPPGGGNQSVYVGWFPELDAQGISQRVRVPDSASIVNMSFWARGPHGPVYFRVKTPASLYTSDTLINPFQMEGWHQYSISLSGGLGAGDSITVILADGIFDSITLTLDD